MNNYNWNIKQYLSEFCHFVGKNPGADADVNILFTGQTLWWIKDGHYNTKVKGLSYVGQTCNPDYSCIIVGARDGFKSLEILVHEFGHNMGAQHDGEEDYGTESCDGDHYIMSPTVSIGKNLWSDCSLKSFRKYLMSLEKNEESFKIKCMSKVTAAVSNDLSIVNNKMSSAYSNVCEKITCKDDFFAIKTWGALDGTKCGPNSECLNGRCRRGSQLVNNFVNSSQVIARSVHIIG
ncbi:unnamed protein product [Medioppia subpectinata]|uniref:Peptidase M12B domain-containing protein n=1 Tax=Medioppia subpectinata TaxID=1979941 RepID=A0A7R9PYE7_9ACAR|nr:unnamed protein product [Medioppia subpectinata]CAG2105812.1 unnamed protein product [Medioppia subpectinata]